MPLIQQTNFDKEVALLQAVGISTGKNGSIEERFQQELLNGGIAPEDIVAKISEIMESGENSSVKLAATKVAMQLYMHPAFVPRKESEKKEAPSIVINVSGGDVKLQNILTPQNPSNFIGENDND